MGLLRIKLTGFTLRCSGFITLLLDYRSWASQKASEPGVSQAGAVFCHREVPVYSLNIINPDT